MKKNKYLWLILLFSLLPLLPILINSLLVHTHDGPVQLARMAAWFKGLKDGQIPVRWAGELNYGFGTPVLVFMYPWPYFLSAIFLSLGFSLANSFELVLFFSFFLSGPLFFLFAKQFFKDEKKGFLAAVFYQLASFRLVEIVVRGAFGEVWTYTFLPLALLGLTKIFQKEKRSGFILASLGTALLILTHNSVSLVFFGALVFFVLIFAPDWPKRFLAFISLFFGLLLSAFYWLPALWGKRYTYGDLFMKDLYLEHFPSLKQLFLPNLLNKPWGWVNDIPTQIGLFHFLALFLILFLLLQKRLKGLNKKIAIFSGLLFGAVLIFMQPISIPLWQKFSLLRQFQFSWRLLALVVLVTSLSVVSFFHFSFFKRFFKKEKFVLGLAILVFLSSLAYWLPPEGFDQIDEDYFWNYPLNTTYFGEANTIWAANPPKDYPKERIEIVGGQGEVSEFSKNSTSQTFNVLAENEINVLSNTIFFPGWRVFANGQEIPIEFQDQNYRGLITFRLPAGEYQVQVKFGRTKDRKAAEAVSLLSWVLFLGLIILPRIGSGRKLGRVQNLLR